MAIPPAAPRRAQHRLVAAAIGLLMVALPAAAQEQTTKFFSVGALGDLQQNETPSTAKIHLSGDAGFATADYSRGAFDAVPKDLDEIAFAASANVTFELMRDRSGWLSDLALTLGADQGLADQVQPTDSGQDDWYEANYYAGLVASLGSDWAAGVTYTVFTCPNDICESDQEIALAAMYTAQNAIGDLKPQAKAAASIDEGDGLYTEIGVAPEFDVFRKSAYPLTVELPVRLGVGFDDFYGAGSGTTGYIGIGATGSVPLAFIPNDYGSWTLSAGIDVLIREDDLVDAGGPFADDDTVIPIGSLTVSFTY